MATLRQLRARWARKFHIRAVLGPRCRVYSAGCPVCDGWHFFDVTARFPTVEEHLATTWYADGMDGVDPDEARASIEKFIHALLALQMRSVSSVWDGYHLRDETVATAEKMYESALAAMPKTFLLCR